VNSEIIGKNINDFLFLFVDKNLQNALFKGVYDMFF